jgi:hypothetical protein
MATLMFLDQLRTTLGIGKGRLDLAVKQGVKLTVVM